MLIIALRELQQETWPIFARKMRVNLRRYLGLRNQKKRGDYNENK
jgi:hypothetical protein